MRGVLPPPQAPPVLPRAELREKVRGLLQPQVGPLPLPCCSPPEPRMGERAAAL